MIEPWIGSRWGEPQNLVNGLKLLILGESAHDAEKYGISPSEALRERE
jgi:hypothetical protein